MDGNRGPLKARTLLICLLAGCAAVLLGIFLHKREPHFEGTCLSDWLQAPQSAARATALDSIGTNALPWLTRWLMQTNPEPQWRKTTRAFLQRTTKLSWRVLDYPLDQQQLGFTGLYALGTNAAPAAPIVVKLLMSPENRVRNSAMTALALMGPEVYRILVKELEAAPDDRWPSIAAVLGRIGQPDQDAAEALLRRFAKSRLDGNRALCLSALAKVGRNSPGTVQLLETNLVDNSQVVRDAAVIGLCALGSEARPVVLSMLSVTNMSPGVRYSLVQHLKAIEHEAALPHLAMFLRDPDPLVRSAASLELAGFIPNHPEVIGLVAQQLRDPAVSMTALRILKHAHGRSGEPLPETAGTVTTTLVSLYGELKSGALNDADPELKRVANALREIDPEIAATIGISSYTTDRRAARP
jgi:HEAT repeat protein